METKAHIRKRILAARDGMAVSERMEKSRRIAARVMEHPAYRHAEYLLCYVSYRSEADMSGLMQQALKEGKKVYCPKVHGGKNGNENGNENKDVNEDADEGVNGTGNAKERKKMEMDFYRIRSLDDLKEGYKGIMEPPACAALMFTKDTALEGQCLMIMPGSVFDRERNRIGYGGGYYDRYLEKYGGITVMAVCFDLQIVGKVPAEEYDRKADMILTESCIYC